MDIALKDKIVEKIIQSNDDSIGLSETDFWSDLPTPVQQAIDKAKNKLDQGEGTPHEEVMAKIKSRFLNNFTHNL